MKRMNPVPSPSTSGGQRDPVVIAGSAVAVARRIEAALQSYVHRGQREKQIQDSIEYVLRRADFASVQREFRLSAKDRPDFLIDDRVVIEVKMRASSSAVLWQLGRYALDDRVEAIVVATPRFSTLSGLPREIHRVPVFPVALRGPGLSL